MNCLPGGVPRGAAAIVLFFLLSSAWAADPPDARVNDWENPGVTGINKLAPHAAFFAYRGPIQPEQHKNDGSDLPKSKQKRSFYAFDRLVYGAVRVRTDGERVLVAVESASANIKEAYAFKVSPRGRITLDDFTLI